MRTRNHKYKLRRSFRRMNRARRIMRYIENRTEESYTYKSYMSAEKSFQHHIKFLYP
jgi:hypothetical protein